MQLQIYQGEIHHIEGLFFAVTQLLQGAGVIDGTHIPHPAQTSASRLGCKKSYRFTRIYPAYIFRS